MADSIYGGGSGGGGSIYSGAGLRSGPKRPKHDHGLGGFAKHLLGDIRDAAVGLPSGTLHLVRHPIASIEEMGKTTWHDWSPLFHGNVGEFGHRFYAHPLGPMLDVAALFTLGGGAAGKLAKVAVDHQLVEEAGLIGTRAHRLAEYSRGGAELKFEHAGQEFNKVLPKNPSNRYRMEKQHELMNAVSEHLPGWFGETTSLEARAGRRAVRENTARHVARMMQVSAILKAAHDLTGADAVNWARKSLKMSHEQAKTFGYHHDIAKAVPDEYVVNLKTPELHSSRVQSREARLEVANRDYAKGLEALPHLAQMPRQQAVASARAELKTTQTGISKLVSEARDLRTSKAPKKVNRLAPNKKVPNRGGYRGNFGVYRDRILQKEREISAGLEELRSHEASIRQYLKGHREFVTAEKAVNTARKSAEQKLNNFYRPSTGGIEADMKQFGSRYTISAKQFNADPKKWLEHVERTHDGKILILPKETLARYNLEAFNSMQTLKFLSKPTNVWKVFTLGYRPAFLLNNAVGNTLMYLMANSPGAAMRGAVDTMRQLHGEKIHKQLNGVESILSHHGNYQQKWFKDQLTNNLNDTTLTGKLGKYSLFGLTHKLSDVALRRSQINVLMRDNAQVQRLMKRRGWSLEKAADAVLARDARRGNGRLRRQVSNQVMDVMGDYHTLAGWERHVRDIVPFYTWDRHITRHIVRVLGQAPQRVDFLAKTGQQGTEATEKILGDIPRFMKGVVPLSILGLHIDHPSRVAVLSTQGLNPYATIPDLADTASAIAGNAKGSGESVGAQLNPFIQALVEQLGGHQLLTDAPVKRHPGGVLGGLVLDPVENLQLYKTADRLFNGPPEPRANKKTGAKTPFLFEKNFEQELASLLGLPVKQYNKKRGREIKKKEDRRG